MNKESTLYARMYVSRLPSRLTISPRPSLLPLRSPRTSFGLLQFGFHPSQPSILHPSSSDPLLRGLALHPCAPSSPPAISRLLFLFCLVRTVVSLLVLASPSPGSTSSPLCNKGLHTISKVIFRVPYSAAFAGIHGRVLF